MDRSNRDRGGGTPRPHAPGGERRARPPRILLYSHDTYGLGHIRRNLLICNNFSKWTEKPQTLLATGSPRAQAFDLPAGCDTVKLPSVLKQPDGTYAARSLDIPFREIREMRTAILMSACRHFRPDLLLVDHSPAGMDGELMRLLQDLRRRTDRPRVVLGLRDVIDDPDRVRAEWKRLGVWDPMADLYDRVLVYGDPRVRTTADELGLSDFLPGRVVHTGYLGSSSNHGDSRRTSDPMILVTAGGGGDGQALLRQFAEYLESLERPTPFRSVVVTGPFLSRQRYEEISARLRATGHRVAVIRFTDRMRELLDSASGVVSMGGYNAIVELLDRGLPALVVPRDKPRLEQTIRARRLSRVSRIEAVSTCELSSDHLGRFVEGALAERSLGRGHDLDMNGLAAVDRELRNLLGLEAGDGGSIPIAREGRHASRLG